MSYRNPQIIIDRSSEIWADNISKIGQGIANTIQAYSQAKANAAAAAKKSQEGYSVLTAQSAEKQRALIDKAGKTFKGSDKQFEEWQKKAREYGEEILPFQVDNVLNTNLTNEQRADNRKKIGDFEAWLDSSVKSIGGVVDKTSYVTDNKITSANYGRKYMASGNTKMEKFNNYAAGFGLTNQEVEGMTLESYNAGDRGNETIGVKYSITPEQYKKFVDSKMLDEGALGEPDDKGNYHGKWERNLKKWGSSDQQLFREIFDEGDVNEALKLAGFIGDDDKWTNKHLATEMSLEVIDGVEYTRQHINPDGIFKDKTYKGVKMSQAKALLAMGDEESFHALSRLGWGDKATIEQWNSKNEEDKEEFLYQLMFEQDMSRLMGLPNGQLPETRVANKSDVDYYKKMGWGDIIEGEDHVWFATRKASKIAAPKGLTRTQIKDSEETKQIEQEANAASTALFTDTENFFVNRSYGSKGVVTEASINEGVVTIRFTTGSGSRDEEKNLVQDTDDKSYDVTNPSQISILAEKLYPGKDNKKFREAFVNQMNQKYGESKTGIGESKAKEIPNFFADTYGVKRGKYD